MTDTGGVAVQFWDDSHASPAPAAAGTEMASLPPAGQQQQPQQHAEQHAHPEQHAAAGHPAESPHAHAGDGSHGHAHGEHGHGHGEGGEHHAPLTHGTTFVDTTIDSRIRRSSFARQQTKLYKPETAVSHTWALVSAVLSTGCVLVEVVTGWILIGNFFYRKQYGSSASLLAIHVLSALTSIEFDWLNNGRRKYWFADVLQLRVLVELYQYWQDAKKHKNVPWAGKDFRSAVRFETFLMSMASLIVQTHVMIADPDNINWVQRLSICFTSFVGLHDLLHFFKYVSVHNETYFIMMVKAIINTMTRTALIAYLVGKLKLWTWLWVGVSYALGIVIYLGSVFIARRLKRDDPMEFRLCHLAFGNLIAQHMCFISFPFAPTHSISDWWIGYIVSEIKINIENICMVAAVAKLYPDAHDLLYWSSIFFELCIFMANLTALIFLHKSVTKQLKVRGLYSSALIVKLFAYICSHMKANLKRKKIAKEELHHHDDPDLDDGHHSDDERAVAAGAAAPASPEQPPRPIDHLAAPQAQAQAQPAAAAPAAAPAAVAALPAVQVQVQASAAAPSTFG